MESLYGFIVGAWLVIYGGGSSQGFYTIDKIPFETIESCIKAKEEIRRFNKEENTAAGYDFGRMGIVCLPTTEEK